MIDWLNVINKLKKEKPDLYFTRVCRPLPNWCVDHVITHRSADGVPYGYYEIKESSMGPIMLCVERQSVHSSDVEITIKSADYGWCIYHVDFGPCTYGHYKGAAVYELIEDSKRYPSNMSEKDVIEKWKHFCDNPKPQKEAEKKPIKGITALQSFEAIMTVVDRRRPYEPDDWGEKSIGGGYIPDLVIALLMTANFAGAPVWLKNAVPQNKKVATVANQQPRTQANCINYFTALQKVKGR